MIDLYLRGVGLWTPGHADLAAWCGGRRDPGAVRPEAQLLSGTLRRRATPLTRMALEALAQAAVQGGAELSGIPSVWGCAHGENLMGVALLDMIHSGEGKLSPTKFHNSVYNTAAGYASIALGNRELSTTLSGGREIVGSCLLEASCLLGRGASEVMVVLADEPYPPPFDAQGPGDERAREPLALALHVSRKPAGACARLSALQRADSPGSEAPERFADLYIAGALPLLECVAARTPGRMALELASGERARWSIELSFPDPSSG